MSAVSSNSDISEHIPSLISHLVRNVDPVVTKVENLFTERLGYGYEVVDRSRRVE